MGTHLAGDMFPQSCLLIIAGHMFRQACQQDAPALSKHAADREQLTCSLATKPASLALAALKRRRVRTPATHLPERAG